MPDLKRKAIALKQKDPSRSASDIATELDTTKDAVQKWLKGAGLGHKASPFRAPRMPKKLTAVGNRLILQDLHSVTLHRRLLDLAIDRALFHGVDGTIIGGDWLVGSKWSKYPSMIVPASLRRELSAVNYAADLLIGEVGALDMIFGNHDRRLVEKFDGEFQEDDGVDGMEYFKRMLASPEMQVQLRLSLHNSMELTSQGERYLISHEFKYSKKRNAVAEKLVAKYRMHVIHGHQHLIGKALDSTGRYWAIDNGCMCRQDLTDYPTLNISSMPDFQPGFTVVKDGEAHVYALVGKNLKRL